MINVTELLSGFAERLQFEDLDEATIEQTRMYIADYIASVYAGCKINGAFNRAVLSIIEEMDCGKGATVLAGGKKLSAEHAAFMNAVYAHGADMDDGNRKARGHISAHVMSAVFALAETMEVTWKEVIVAVIVGYEIYNRIAAAIQPDLVHRGFHSTGTAGTVACAAACAKLMGLDAKGIYNAIAFGAVQASGLLIVTESGQACKPINPANAARAGIISAKLAQKGIVGPVNPLESEKGWFHAMGDHLKEEAITDGLSSEYTINECYLKPYPSCRHTHCGLEAGIKIHDRILKDGRRINDIRKVNVYIYDDAIQIAGQILFPQTVDEAKFSIQYSLAVALLSGNFTLDDLEPQITEDRKKLIEMIELFSDSRMEDTSAGIRGARAEVSFADGAVYSETVFLPKGESANPFTWEDMRLKMEACMSGILQKDQINETLDRIRMLSFEEKFTTICDVVV